MSESPPSTTTLAPDLQTVVESATEAPCIFQCGETVAAERREIGYNHCMSIDCIAEWRRRKLELADLVLVFVHKQGLMWVKRDDVKKNDMKRQGGM